MNCSPQHYWIQNDADLIQSKQALLSSKSMAIDLEFYRRKTFSAELCLILIAHKNGVFVIEALNTSIKPMLKTLLQQLCSQHRLIFHSARQDLEIFDDIYQQYPKKFIDIQYSGAYLQLNPQPSLNCLADKLLSRSKCLQTQSSDWRQRPLSDKQLAYAFAEAKIIWDCYCQLKKQLNQHQWQAILEDSADCLQSFFNSKNLSLKAEQITTQIGFSPAQQQLLLHLLGWRVDKAKQHNIPVIWVLSNQQIQQLVKRPKEKQTCIAFNSKRRKYRSQIKPKLRAELQQELNILLQNYPITETHTKKYPYKTHSLNPEEEKIYQRVSQSIQHICETYSINISQVAGKKSIVEFIRDPIRPQPLNRGWRHYLFEETLQKILNY